jgi:diaminohydroxyphosphoribosylaminopyrimidine deaminase/5-amino-6-(5-phosphoribosylamino)uracil reductase
VLAQLADEGVTRLLVEGGPQVWRAFASEGLADEIVLFRAGAAAGGPPEATAALAAALAPRLDLAFAEGRRFGADSMTILRVLSSAA